MRPWLLHAIAALQLVVSAIAADIDTPTPNDTPVLSADEVNTIIAQAAGFMKGAGTGGVIAVVDREGHILAIYRMTDSSARGIQANEQATAKARTAAFFSSDENAFTSRTAQFIVQANFPPGVRNVDAGPLFGVPFSNLPFSDAQLQAPPLIVFAAPLTCTDITRPNATACFPLPAGSSNRRPLQQPLVITPLTDDPGGVPLYKNGRIAGGVGVEIEGFGVLGEGIPDDGIERFGGKPMSGVEEQAALAGARGFAAPRGIRGNRIVINGFRFPYIGGRAPRFQPLAVSELPANGGFEPYFDTDETERSASGAPLADPYGNTYSGMAVVLSGARGTPAQEFPRRGWAPRFPPRDSPLGILTAADVRRLVGQAVDRANQTRGAIRNPRGTAAQVWIAVVDTAGNICGVFRTFDATLFSFDVCVQKARTAAFFSTNQAGLSTRSIGFIAQTLYPPGIDKHQPGPLSGLRPFDKDQDSRRVNLAGGSGRLTEISQLAINRDGTPLREDYFAIPGCPSSPIPLHSKTVQTVAERITYLRDGRLSPLQTALSVDLSLNRPRVGTAAPPTALPNGITLFAGGVPLYKNGQLAGALGISGDGVDQDDYIAFAGQAGFEPPEGVRSDEASDAAISQALQAAVAKLKVQFPNLTNGSSAVLDVIARRLSSGGDLFQGLRIPYVKFPRSPLR